MKLKDGTIKYIPGEKKGGICNYEIKGGYIYSNIAKKGKGMQVTTSSEVQQDSIVRQV